MTNMSRTTVIRLLAFGLLVLATTGWAQNRPPIVEQIAKTYGIDSFGQIEAIRYTWNGEIPGLFKVAHKWEWEPKTGKVSYEGTDKAGKPVKVTYMRSELSSAPDNVKNEVEPAFVNDNYWLLFPFHAYWDTSATVTDQGMHKLPAGVGSAQLVSVKYPAEVGGYTPRRHLGSLRRQRPPRRVYGLPPGRAPEAEPRQRALGRLQKSRSSAGLNRTSRHRRWQASAHLHF